MSRLEKLNARLHTGGKLSFRELQTLLERYGWRLARVSGSHHIYKHPMVPRPLPVVPNGAEAREYQVQQFRAMIDLYGLKLEDK